MTMTSEGERNGDRETRKRKSKSHLTLSDETLTDGLRCIEGSGSESGVQSLLKGVKVVDSTLTLCAG